MHMQTMDSVKTPPSITTRYDGVARLLHWAVAALIVAQYVLANLAERAEHGGSKLEQLALLANHKSVGITVLALVILRLAWRFAHPPPPLPSTLGIVQRRLAWSAHTALYLLIALVPLTGWMMSSAHGFSVSWFNLFALPDLIAAGETRAERLEEIHETLAGLLFAIALLHILAALKHYFFDRDTILQRMASPINGCLFAALLMSIVIIGGRLLREEAAPNTTTAPPQQASSLSSDSARQIKPSTLPRWVIDYANSAIEFRAVQAGASFTGLFNEWQGAIHFDNTALDDSYFDVEIDLLSVDAGNGERNEALASAAFFDSGDFPTARFTSHTIEINTSHDVPDYRYVAHAHLALKGGAHPLQFYFNIDDDNARQVLQGAARLDRLALGVGTGEWRDTSWIGQYVMIDVRVLTQRS